MAQKIIEFPQPLCEKYRPRKVSEFIGLQKPKRVIESFLKRPYDSAWLFLGPSGVGKTTMALAISEELGAELHHIPSRSCDLDAVETVTRICHSAGFNFQTGKPCPFHVVIIDEADRMTPAAQDALLSKLDATARPPQTIFIFTANTTQALEPRFLSRLQPLDFTSESLEDELAEYLEKVYKKEKGRFALSFVEICKIANYNVRDGLNRLQTELLIGTDRDDLPPEKELILEEHTHNCKKCHKTWKHREPGCELPYRHVCPQCGGTTSVGQERAKKAWDTIRKKLREEVTEEVTQVKAKPKKKRA